MSVLWIWMYVLLAGGPATQNLSSAASLLRRAEREGTPLVDRLDDRRYVQLTFVWHGSADTKNVAVVGTFLPAPLAAMTKDALLAKGYEVHYQQFVGGHDYLSWRGTLADGLTALIGR